MSVEIKKMLEEVVSFCKERNWDKALSLKEEALSLVVEATEVLQHFQWKKESEIRALSQEKKEEISKKLVDVLYWILLMNHSLETDIEAMFAQKMDENRTKYPVVEASADNQLFSEDELEKAEGLDGADAPFNQREKRENNFNSRFRADDSRENNRFERRFDNKRSSFGGGNRFGGGRSRSFGDSDRGGDRFGSKDSSFGGGDRFGSKDSFGGGDRRRSRFGDSSFERKPRFDRDSNSGFGSRGGFGGGDDSGAYAKSKDRFGSSSGGFRDRSKSFKSKKD